LSQSRSETKCNDNRDGGHSPLFERKQSSMIGDWGGQAKLGLLMSLSGYIELSVPLGHIGFTECMMHIILLNVLQICGGRW